MKFVIDIRTHLGFNTHMKIGDIAYNKMNGDFGRVLQVYVRFRNKNGMGSVMAEGNGTVFNPKKHVLYSPLVYFASLEQGRDGLYDESHFVHMTKDSLEELRQSKKKSVDTRMDHILELLVGDEKLSKKINKKKNK